MTISKMMGLVICIDTDILLIGEIETINLHQLLKYFFLCPSNFMQCEGVTWIKTAKGKLPLCSFHQGS